MQDIPSSAKLEASLHRKMLWLLAPTFLALGVFYIWYVRAAGLTRFPWTSSALCASGLAGLLWLRFKADDALRGVQIVCLGLFCAFTYSSANQLGIYSSSLWWLLLPPVFLLLAGSIRLGVATGAFLMLYIGALAWWGPKPIGKTSLVLPNAHLQMLIAEEVSTLVMLLVTGQIVRWRIQLQGALEQARTAACAAAEAKARFLANISHEIRTPLNGIMGSIALMRTAKLNDARREQLMSLQQQSAQALLALVNDVLDWSKLEAGKVTLEAEPLDLRQLLAEANELFAVQAFGKGIELSNSCAADVPLRMMGDATRLRQILNNLTSNAVKFTAQGGVHLHLSLDMQDTTTPRPDGRRQLRIDVADTGIGITPERVKELFTAFNQGDASVTRKYGGTGLGLSISQELARLMEGQIEVRSTPGQGATFTLKVPLAEEAASAGTTPAPLQRRPDMLLACASSGLLRHMRSLLAERGVEPDTMDRLPTLGELDGRAMLLLDAASLSGQAPDQLDAADLTGVHLVLMEPLNYELAQSGINHWHRLFKPVSRAALDALLKDASGEPAAPLPSCKVLVGQDDPVNQLVIQAMLQELGARCKLAQDGQQVLDLLKIEHFDAVLVDTRLPVLDGFETVRRWRAHERHQGLPAVPVIALTADTAQESRQACLTAGMSDTLSKPFDLAALRSCLRSAAVSSAASGSATNTTPAPPSALAHG